MTRDTSGVAQAFRPAMLATCLLLVFPFGVAAQPQQPTIAEAPPKADALTRYDFHMSIEWLSLSVPTPPPAVPEERFSSDAHFGGSFDIVDLKLVRLGVIADYEAVMGDEYRRFDPNQGNYTLEGFGSFRVAADTEVAMMFHHVSRHLSDRPKDFGVAYNEIGGRVMRRQRVGTVTVDVEIEGGRTIQHSFVDYTWLGEGHLFVRRAVNPRVGVFVHGTGRVYGVNETLANRGTQAGGLVEAGIRLAGRAAAVELFAGYEKRIDAYPLDRLSQRWGIAGFRLVSR